MPLALNERINRKKILLILNWCIKKFGKNKNHKFYPKLIVYRSNGHSHIIKSKKISAFYGYFDEKNNKIIIFIKEHKSIYELCCTIIHEYKHYLLNDDEYNIIKNKMIKNNNDIDDIRLNHPHEIKTRKFELKWGIVCFNELKYLLYKK